MLGHDENIEVICDGDLSLDIGYAPTRLQKLCKMDSAVVLFTYRNGIVRANVQLTPNVHSSYRQVRYPAPLSGTSHHSNRLPDDPGQPFDKDRDRLRWQRHHVLADSATSLP